MDERGITLLWWTQKSMCLITSGGLLAGNAWSSAFMQYLLAFAVYPIHPPQWKFSQDHINCYSFLDVADAWLLWKACLRFPSSLPPSLFPSVNTKSKPTGGEKNPQPQHPRVTYSQVYSSTNAHNTTYFRSRL